MTAILLCLEYFGIVWHNALFAEYFPVKSLDVSHHQGRIDWQQVAKLNRYTFVFIKATEGHDFIDDQFANNWAEAKKSGLKVGAYHFFSMRSSGVEQAKYFIATVPKEDSALPPVIDIEIPLDHEPSKVRAELLSLASELEKYYQKKPILYMTYEQNSTYLNSNFDDFDIWIRDISVPPFRLRRNWIFWQYHNRARVDGIKEYPDVNVFNGTKEQFDKKFN